MFTLLIKVIQPCIRRIIKSIFLTITFHRAIKFLFIFAIVNVYFFQPLHVHIVKQHGKSDGLQRMHY